MSRWLGSLLACLRHRTPSLMEGGGDGRREGALDTREIRNEDGKLGRYLVQSMIGGRGF